MSSEQWAQSHRVAFWRMERRFFERLHIEAVKVDAFFCAMERELERISQALAVDAEASLRRQDQQRLALLRQRYREHYVEIMELVNFIELNATGFEKILKKHDKVTGLQTKAVFQRQVLQTFTFYQAAQQTRQTDTHDDDDHDEDDDHHAGNGAPTSSGH
jgi:SPX domain protein involved in polyphosphate accumulation